MSFWTKLFADNFSDEGFIKRSQAGLLCEAIFSPVAVYVGDCLWEHKFLVKAYRNGVSLARKGNTHEWFIDYNKIKPSNESQRPFQVMTSSGNLEKISFGGDLVDKAIMKLLNEKKPTE